MEDFFTMNQSKITIRKKIPVNLMAGLMSGPDFHRDFFSSPILGMAFTGWVFLALANPLYNLHPSDMNR